MSDNTNKNHYISLASIASDHFQTNKDCKKSLDLRSVWLLCWRIIFTGRELIHQDNWRWRHYQELHHQHGRPSSQPSVCLCLSSSLPATRMCADVSLSFLHSNYRLERISPNKHPRARISWIVCGSVKGLSRTQLA